VGVGEGTAVNVGVGVAVSVGGMRVCVAVDVGVNSAAGSDRGTRQLDSSSAGSSADNVQAVIHSKCASLGIR
jgi:hypothetical protein